MDIMEKQELADTLREMKELVDEVLPIESSVVRDQVLMALMANTIQMKFVAKQAAPPATIPDFTGMATKLRDVMEATDKTVAASLTIAASRMVREEDKLSSESAQGWAWEAYEYFLRILRVA